MLLIAIDIGTFSVKGVALDPKRKYQIVAFAEEHIEDHQPQQLTAAPATPVAEQPGDADEPTGEWAPPTPEDAPVVESTTVDDDEEQPWQRAITALLARLDSEGGAIVIAMPHGKSFSLQVQDIPFSDPNKVSRILPGMLGSKLPFGLDELLYDFFINAHEGEVTENLEEAPKPEAFVGATRKSDMQDLLDDLSDVHVNPTVVGIPELMLRYLAEGYVPESQHQTVALIDMGHERTLVHVIEKGQTVLARSINHGGKHVTESIAAKFKASYAEANKVKHSRGAIVPAGQIQDPSIQALNDAITGSFQPLLRDLRRTFKALYARERVEINQIYIFGGNSRIQNISTYLTEQLGVPVDTLSLKGLVEGEDELDVDAPAKMHTPLAMALQVVQDRAGIRGVNLRQGEFSYKGRSSYVNSQLKKLGALAAFLLVLLGVALFLQKRDLDTQRNAMRAAVTKETKKVFGKPLYKADAIKKRVETQETSDGGFVPKMSAYEVFFELSSRIRPDVKLELSRIEVDAERNLIQLYGTTTTPQAVDDIVSDLEQLECLKSIKKDKLQVKKEDEVNFELQISSACS